MDNDFPSNEVNYIDFDPTCRFEKKPYNHFWWPVFYLLLLPFFILFWCWLKICTKLESKPKTISHKIAGQWSTAGGAIKCTPCTWCDSECKWVSDKWKSRNQPNCQMLVNWRGFEVPSAVAYTEMSSRRSVHMQWLMMRFRYAICMDIIWSAKCNILFSRKRLSIYWSPKFSIKFFFAVDFKKLMWREKTTADLDINQNYCCTIESDRALLFVRVKVTKN